MLTSHSDILAGLSDVTPPKNKEVFNDGRNYHGTDSFKLCELDLTGLWANLNNEKQSS